jgi:hypothetical protein
MKPSQKGLNMSKKTKLVFFIVLTTVLMISIYTSYTYGKYSGYLTGYHHGVGTEGICEKLDKQMEGDYCVLNDEQAYKYYVNCTWGQYISYDEKKVSRLSNLDIRLIFTQCRLIDMEAVQ